MGICLTCDKPYKGFKLKTNEPVRNPYELAEQRTGLCDCKNVCVAMAGHCMKCGGSVPERPEDKERKEVMDNALRDYLNKDHGISYPETAEQKRQESIVDRLRALVKEVRTNSREGEGYMLYLYATGIQDLIAEFSASNQIPNQE